MSAGAPPLFESSLLVEDENPLAETLRIALGKLAKEHPEIKFNEIYNTVDGTKVQYDAAMEGLVEGAVPLAPWAVAWLYDAG